MRRATVRAFALWKQTGQHIATFSLLRKTSVRPPILRQPLYYADYSTSLECRYLTVGRKKGLHDESVEAVGQTQFG
jgi:hypothetical protein